MNYLIRQENQNDYLEVNDVIKSAFYREDKPDDFNEWVLVENIRKSEYYIEELSLVAKIDDKVVGHIMFTPMTIDNKDKQFKSIAMAPVSVLKGYQKQGIGTKLVESGIDVAKKLGYDSIIVMGHPSYYTRFGFKKASNWKIGIDDSFDSDFLFALELKHDSLKNVSGIIEYCPPFYSKEGELI